MQTKEQHQLAPMRDLQKARAPTATHATDSLFQLKTARRPVTNTPANFCEAPAWLSPTSLLCCNKPENHAIAMLHPHAAAMAMPLLQHAMAHAAPKWSVVYIHEKAPFFRL